LVDRRDSKTDTGGEFIWGVPLGCLGHEAGKGRLTSWGKGSAVEPRIDAQQIEGDRAEDVLQMRLGLAEGARAAQPADAYGLGMGAFNAGSLSVHERELVGVLAGPCGASCLLVLARVQGEHAVAVGGAGTLGPAWTGSAIVNREPRRRR